VTSWLCSRLQPLNSESHFHNPLNGQMAATATSTISRGHTHPSATTTGLACLSMVDMAHMLPEPSTPNFFQQECIPILTVTITISDMVLHPEMQGLTDLGIHGIHQYYVQHPARTTRSILTPTRMHCGAIHSPQWGLLVSLLHPPHCHDNPKQLNMGPICNFLGTLYLSILLIVADLCVDLLQPFLD